MKKTLRWTTLALQDLESIRDYIHRDKPLAAGREAQRIRNAVNRLARFPASGRPSRSIPGVREMVAGSYRIFYRTGTRGIDILRIYHGKRDIPL